jgi:putative ABC transport system permease protein
MNLQEIFLLSFNALKERRVRSALTILMVMTGASLLVAVNGIAASFADFFNKQFSNLAPNVLFVTSSQQAQGPGGGGPVAGPPPPAKITLNAAITNRIRTLPFVTDVFPAYMSQVTMQSQSESKTDSILAIDPQKLLVIAPTLEFIDGSTIRPNNPSAMIVANDVANPPGDTNPFIALGQTVKVRYSFVDADSGQQKEESKSFIVTAIMKLSGNPTIDKSVVINKDAGNALLHKSSKFDALFTVAQSANFVDAVEQEIRTLYANNIGITTVKAILKTVHEFTSGVSTFLISIAVISLIVGAVGTITTLYTSVIERTREIGTLKAIGAQNRHVLALFLFEALLIGVFGATIGLLAGIAGGYALSIAFAANGQPRDPIFLVQDMFTVWLISIGLSVLAGFFPALKASRLLPIEALRPQ